MPADTTQQIARPNQRLRCLVVGFERTTLAFIANALSFFKPGFTVFTASDYNAAIGWLPTARPHFVVLGDRITSACAQELAGALDGLDTTDHRHVIVQVATSQDGERSIVGGSHRLLLRNPLDLEEVLQVGRTVAAGFAAIAAGGNVVAFRRDVGNRRWNAGG